MRALLPLVVLIACAPAPPPPTPPTPAIVDAGAASEPIDAGLGLLGGVEDPHFWPTVAKVLAIDEAEITRCAAPSDCTTIPHFTRCCVQLPIATALAKTVLKRRKEYGFVQTKDEKTLCEIGDCSGAPWPVTCADSKCVVATTSR